MIRSARTGCWLPPGALPQSAERLDTRREIWDDEVRVRVRRLNLDAASYRQLAEKHTVDGQVDGEAVRDEVLTIVGERGKMQNPVTGSGGMLVGVVEEVGPRSPLGLEAGQPVATLVSLTLTPLVIEDGLQEWDGLGEQVPTDGYAILFGQSIAAVLPEDLPEALSLAVMDVCGAPALTARVVDGYVSSLRQAQDGAGSTTGGPTVAVIGGAGKSGSLALVAAKRAGARRTIGVVPHEQEATLLRDGRRWPTRSSSPTPVTRSRCASPYPAPAGRRTSPWSASTCPGARVARSCPPHPRAPSSSSRWPRRSARPRSAPRVWPPT